MRQRWEIACYGDAGDHQPVVDYIYALTNLDDVELIFHVIGRLSRVGLALVDTKMAKHIEGPVFELRKYRHRVMFAEDTKNGRFVLLSAFYKYTQKTPLEEIDKALDYWGAYLKTGNCVVFAVPSDDF